jgi:hypothetical protein
VHVHANRGVIHVSVTPRHRSAVAPKCCNKFESKILSHELASLQQVWQA